MWQKNLKIILALSSWTASFSGFVTFVTQSETSLIKMCLSCQAFTEFLLLARCCAEPRRGYNSEGRNVPPLPPLGKLQNGETSCMRSCTDAKQKLLNTNTEPPGVSGRKREASMQFKAKRRLTKEGPWCKLGWESVNVTRWKGVTRSSQVPQMNEA